MFHQAPTKKQPHFHMLGQDADYVICELPLVGQLFLKKLLLPGLNLKAPEDKVFPGQYSELKIVKKKS